MPLASVAALVATGVSVASAVELGASKVGGDVTTAVLVVTTGIDAEVLAGVGSTNPGVCTDSTGKHALKPMNKLIV